MQQSNVATITTIVEENKAIKFRTFDKPLREIDAQLKKMNEAKEINSDMVSLLQTYLQENNNNYAVTQAMDNQVKIFALSLKERFLEKLINLLIQIAKDSKNSDYSVIFRNAEIQHKDMFFLSKNGVFDPSDDLLSLPEEQNHEKFCQIVADTRVLITAVNNYLIQTANPAKQEYDDLIKNLADALHDFYQFRICHPYVFSSLLDTNCKPVDVKKYLEIIVDGLRQRLIYEQDYSNALKQVNSSAAYEERASILYNFLNATGKLFISLDATNPSSAVTF